MARGTDATFVCFSQSSGSQSHYRAVRELYDAGIWIGFLSAEKHAESYRGLPSFSQLKSNRRKLNSPYPSPIEGSAREERKAVCRGCCGDDSQLITLREIPFISKTKLVIMPLQGEKRQELFCIMLPQNDRTLPGLQSYRPYEIHSADQSKTFLNSFMLLSLRNTSHFRGTLETILRVIEPRQTPSITPEAAASHDLNDGGTIESPSAERLDLNMESPNLGGIAGTKRRHASSDAVNDPVLHTSRSTESLRRRSDRGSAADIHSPLELQSLGYKGPIRAAEGQLQMQQRTKSPLKRASVAAGAENETQKRHRADKSPTPQEQQSTSRSSGNPQPSTLETKEDPPELGHGSVSFRNRTNIATVIPQTAESSFQSQSVGLNSPCISFLTKSQRKGIRIIWTVVVKDETDGEDVACDFVCGLDECNRFSELLDLLRRETELDPQAGSAATVLDDTQGWRLTYQPKNGMRKRFSIRKGNEDAFNHFLKSISQLPVWNDNPSEGIDVQLHAVN